MSGNSKVLYFAYGSNMDRSQMRKRCPGARFIDVVYLPGYRLAFTRFSPRWGGGVADIVQHPGKKVWGLLYAMNSKVLEKLDRYEDYPHGYDRIQVEVFNSAVSYTGVWAYRVVQKMDFVPPTTRYYEIIKKAALRHAFPADYLEYLKWIPALMGQRASSPA